MPPKSKHFSLAQKKNSAKEVYQDYMLFRNEILDNIQQNNSQYDEVVLTKKACKLLDRFLFLFFAESKLLLPRDAVRGIINQWRVFYDKSGTYIPLYNRFRKYFGYLHTGHKGKMHEILANKTSLFVPDDILENIKIDDELLYKHLLQLSNYNLANEFPSVFVPKDKQGFHVVLTTHNSRTSRRMIKYNVQKGPALRLGLEEEIELTKIIGEIIQENAYQCIAYNICKDHLHLILVCEYEELTGIIQKTKSISSKLFHRLDISMGHDPLKHGNHLWSQKFFRADLDVWKLASLSYTPGYVYKSTHLENAIPYIINNRKKHGLPASSKLKKIIASFVVSQEEAFAVTYKGGFDEMIAHHDL